MTRVRICAILLLTLATGTVWGQLAMPNGGQIVLGPATQMRGLPFVDIEVRDGTKGLGPYASDPFGYYTYNHVLLDSGASRILMVSDAAQELVNNGLANVGKFSLVGAAGTTNFDISAPYQANFSGTDGIVHTLPQTSQDVRILTNPTFEFGAAASDGGIPGLVGMPAMVNRVTTIDTSTLATFAPLGVTFSDTLPTGNGHRYSVAVDASTSFNPCDGLPAGSPANAPIPTWAPVALVTATIEAQGVSKTGKFLVDTGSQMSVISQAMAFSLGLDTNHDGSLLDEAVGRVSTAGIGGVTVLPVLAIDKFSLATEQGPSLVWRKPGKAGGLDVLVADSGPGIDGILGADLLTSGISQDVSTLELTGAPYFDKINLDFRNLATEGTGQLVFDVNPTYDISVPEPSTLTLLGTVVALLAVTLRRRAIDTRFRRANRESGKTVSAGVVASVVV